MTEFNWIQTFSGKKFFPLAPKAEDVKIEDIAHALSMKCRFGGHCLQFYSVAEHSCRIAEYLERFFGDCKLALGGLLHDGNEAYLPDIPAPVKLDLPAWKAIEDSVDKVVAERFGLVFPWSPEIKSADYRILKTEKDENLRLGPEWPHLSPDGLAGVVEAEYLTPGHARKKFLNLYRDYGGK